MRRISGNMQQELERRRGGGGRRLSHGGERPRGWTEDSRESRWMEERRRRGGVPGALPGPQGIYRDRQPGDDLARDPRDVRRGDPRERERLEIRGLPLDSLERMALERRELQQRRQLMDATLTPHALAMRGVREARGRVGVRGEVRDVRDVPVRRHPAHPSDNGPVGRPNEAPKGTGIGGIRVIEQTPPATPLKRISPLTNGSTVTQNMRGKRPLEVPAKSPSKTPKRTKTALQKGSAAKPATAAVKKPNVPPTPVAPSELLFQHLPQHLRTEPTLRAMTQGFGQLKSVTIMRDLKTKQTTGSGIVTFVKPTDAKRAHGALNNRKVGRGKLHVILRNEKVAEPTTSPKTKNDKEPTKVTTPAKKAPKLTLHQQRQQQQQQRQQQLQLKLKQQREEVEKRKLEAKRALDAKLAEAKSKRELEAKRADAARAGLRGNQPSHSIRLVGQPGSGAGAGGGNFARVGDDLPALIVFHLPPAMTEQELVQLFRPFQAVKAIVMREPATKRSRGYGFVHVPDLHQANRAIAALDKHPIGNVRLSVSLAKPKEETRPVASQDGKTPAPPQMRHPQQGPPSAADRTRLSRMSDAERAERLADAQMMGSADRHSHIQIRKLVNVQSASHSMHPPHTGAQPPSGPLASHQGAPQTGRPSHPHHTAMRPPVPAPPPTGPVTMRRPQLRPGLPGITMSSAERAERAEREEFLKRQERIKSEVFQQQKEFQAQQKEIADLQKKHAEMLAAQKAELLEQQEVIKRQREELEAAQAEMRREREAEERAVREAAEAKQRARDEERERLEDEARIAEEALLLAHQNDPDAVPSMLAHQYPMHAPSPYDDDDGHGHEHGNQHVDLNNPYLARRPQPESIVSPYGEEKAPGHADNPYM